MAVLGLLGPKGAGKSTIAKYLVEKYGAKTYTLAEPLKLLVKNAFDLKHEQLYGTQAEKEAIDPRYNVSARWLMQHIGTEGVRSVFGPDFWIEHTTSKIRKEKPKLAVVDDVRFTNEAEGIQNNFDAGIVIRIWNRSLTNLPTGHPSEDEWLGTPFDDVLDHDGATLFSLHSKIDTLMKRWRLA